MTTASIRSLTGFGQARGPIDGGEVVVELTSLNHKYFDFGLSCPPALSSLEVPLRRLVAQRLVRGRVRMAVRFVPGRDPSATLVLDESRAVEYVRYYSELKTRFNLRGELSAEALLMAPLVIAPAEQVTDREALVGPIEAVTSDALERLLAMQETEGKALASDLRGRIERLEMGLARLREMAPATREAAERTLRERVQRAAGDIAVPADRLAAEVVLLVERSDCTEELVRIASHVGQMRDVLDGGGEVGHRLDFLAQELGREINTVGAKCASAEVGRIVIDFKEEVARLREQVQNLL